MADTVGGDDGLEDWGLEIFGDDFLSGNGGNWSADFKRLADPEHLAESFPAFGRSSGASPN